MLIDNKVDRYPEEGLGIKTVWDFINLYSGKQSEQKGKFDIVTDDQRVGSDDHAKF